jgi:molecular chaperone DnaK
MAQLFGLDFGTTNTLASVVVPDPRTKQPTIRLLTNLQDNKPHPSVVWYPGAKPVVGREAKGQLAELGLGVFGDIVRSPKIYLGSPSGIPVGGVTRPAINVVADLLRYIKNDALERKFQGVSFDRAVITIPVKMTGRARLELREAARDAGISIHQFIHEPLAALYGYLRGGDIGVQIANLERRLVLVFDWGGGTLDLTLCHCENGVLCQVLNVGDTEVGGDEFDRRLKTLVKRRHEETFPGTDWGRIQPSAEARLTEACEDAKIALSRRETHIVFVPDLLASEGPEKDLNVKVSRKDLEDTVGDLVKRGLSNADSLLAKLGVFKEGVEFCLATGGMVSMPAIKHGLTELFGIGRLRHPENALSLISEGAAWIAHDKVPIRLSKPIEILHADDCYVQIFDVGTQLPVEAETKSLSYAMYCVDPRDGFAKFLLARPEWPGRTAPSDRRIAYGCMNLPIHSAKQALQERLKLTVSVDENLVVSMEAISELRGAKARFEVLDLEFGLGLPNGKGGNAK